MVILIIRLGLLHYTKDNFCSLVRVCTLHLQQRYSTIDQGWFGMHPLSNFTTDLSFWSFWLNLFSSFEKKINLCFFSLFNVNVNCNCQRTTQWAVRGSNTAVCAWKLWCGTWKPDWNVDKRAFVTTETNIVERACSVKVTGDSFAIS